MKTYHLNSDGEIVQIKTNRTDGIIIRATTKAEATKQLLRRLYLAAENPPELFCGKKVARKSEAFCLERYDVVSGEKIRESGNRFDEISGKFVPLCYGQTEGKLENDESFQYYNSEEFLKQK